MGISEVLHRIIQCELVQHIRIHWKNLSYLLQSKGKFERTLSICAWDEYACTPFAMDWREMEKEKNMRIITIIVISIVCAGAFAVCWMNEMRTECDIALSTQHIPFNSTRMHFSNPFLNRFDFQLPIFVHCTQYACANGQMPWICVSVCVCVYATLTPMPKNPFGIQCFCFCPCASFSSYSIFFTFIVRRFRFCDCALRTIESTNSINPFVSFPLNPLFINISLFPLLPCTCSLSRRIQSSHE